MVRGQAGPLDFDIVEHALDKRGDGARFFMAEFRPTQDDLNVLGRGGVHSNHFWMQLPPTGRRIVRDNGQYVTVSGKRVAPAGNLEADPLDPWLYETYSRDVTAGAEAKIKAYWERKLEHASRGQFYRQHGRTTLNLQVGASTDDALQIATDAVSTTSVTMECDDTAEHIGLRFQNVTIGTATIDDAILSVRFSNTALDEPQHQVRGELAANAAVFVNASTDTIDSRARTTATVQWNSANLGLTGDGFQEWGCASEGGAGTSIETIIQEIINQESWSNGNALVLIIEQHTLDAARDLRVDAYDQDTSHGATLDIDFTPGKKKGGGPPSPQPTGLRHDIFSIGRTGEELH